MSEFKVYPTSDELIGAAADLWLSCQDDALRERARFSVALSGGSTPKALYELLATEPYRTRIDWAHIFIFWGDERCVPPDDAESNYRMARESLLDHVPVPPDHVYRMRGEVDPNQAAGEYE